MIDTKPSDKYIPWLFILFFIVFMAVDAVMVTLAIRTQTGIVTENAYEKGLSYNDTLQAAAKQKLLGWQDSISIENGYVIYTLKDKDGIPLRDAAIIAHFIRPIQDGYDFSVPLTYNQNSQYKAAITPPLKGEWGVRIEARWRDKHYQHYRTFIIP